MKGKGFSGQFLASRPLKGEVGRAETWGTQGYWGKWYVRRKGKKRIKDLVGK